MNAEGGKRLTARPYVDDDAGRAGDGRARRHENAGRVEARDRDGNATRRGRSGEDAPEAGGRAAASAIARVTTRCLPTSVSAQTTAPGMGSPARVLTPHRTERPAGRLTLPAKSERCTLGMASTGGAGGAKMKS